jgi:deoxyadenosine/deoxycytidine kinase
MTACQTIQKDELEWQKIIRSQNNHSVSAFPVLTICGPSGVGKTTAIKALARNYPVFIETTQGNPHLNRLLERRDDFNAAANQKWFLQRISEYVAGANPRSPFIVDQDPAAIVLVYSRMFMEDGKLSEVQYTSLLRQLLQIEEALQSWKRPRTVLFLDAPADVLHQRVLRRLGVARTPPLRWFEKARNQFVQFFIRLPNAITVSTVELSLEQIISRAKVLIEKSTEHAQTLDNCNGSHG